MFTSLRRRTSLSKATLASAAWRAAGPIGLVAALLIIAPAAVGAPPPPRRDAQRLKDAIDRDAKERLRQVEQQRRADQAKREAQERAQQQAAQDYARSHPKPTVAPFNAAAASPPADRVKSFIIAAKSATSMEQLLAYLPDSEQKTLRGEQANFSLQSVQGRREYYRQRSPNLTEEQLASLTSSPYDVALQYNKSFAEEVMDILDVKIVGDQAELTVATNSGSINGRPVPNGRAYVEMVGEGSLWRVKTNGSSPLVSKPQLNNP
jgi:hypothetical protein